MEQQIWRHERSGDLYAVGLAEGRVLTAIGPLEGSADLDEALETLSTNSDQETAEWIDGCQEAFYLVR